MLGLQRLIWEPVAVFTLVGFVYQGYVTGVLCLVYREELYPDLSRRNHRGVVSSPADDWRYNVVTNDQHRKWLI